MTIVNAWFETTVGATTVRLAPEGISGATINQGITERIRQRLNNFGELGFAESEPQERQGAFTINYSKPNPDIMALMFGSPLETIATSTAKYVNTYTPQDNAIPAVAAGGYGTGMVVDNAVSRAIYIDENGIGQEATRVPFATVIAPAAVTTFSQGANGAFNVSNDLLNKQITFYSEYPATDIDRLAHYNWGEFRVILTGIIRQNKKARIYQVTFSRAELNRQENSLFDPGADTFAINFRDLSNACVMDVKFLKQTVAC
jgi:hypothetical protein